MYTYIQQTWNDATSSSPAVCHVRMMTSPTLPMACESEEMMLIAPMSCKISSAAIVSCLIRLKNHHDDIYHMMMMMMMMIMMIYLNIMIKQIMNVDHIRKIILSLHHQNVT